MAATLARRAGIVDAAAMPSENSRSVGELLTASSERRCGQDRARRLLRCVELWEVPGADDRSHVAVPEVPSEAAPEGGAEVLIAFAERDPHWCREVGEFPVAPRVRENGGIQIAVQPQERSQRARLRLELAIQ